MKFTHPKFKQFILCLTNSKVEYMLVGGYAVILHGYSRGTGDMDVWVNPTESNRARLIEALIQFGYKQEDVSVISNGNPIDGMRGMIEIEEFHIDVITQVDKVNFEDASLHAVCFSIENIDVRVINFENLVASKIFSDRLKDKNDVEQLYKLRRNE